MSSQIIKEAYSFACCVAGGFLFGLLYEMFCLFRKLVRHNRWWVDLEDILYWIICFLCSFCYLYYVNFGVIRFFCVMGAGLGMAIFVKIKNMLTILFKQFKMCLRRLIKRKGEMDLAKEK